MLTPTQEEYDYLVADLMRCHATLFAIQTEIHGPNCSSTYYTRFRLLLSFEATGTECKRLRAEIRVRDALAQMESASERS